MHRDVDPKHALPRTFLAWVRLLGVALACLLPSFGLAQTPLSPWGAHALANQSGTVHWTYYSLVVPSGHRGIHLTAENVSGSGPLEIFIQAGTQNPTDTVHLRRSVPGSRLLDLASDPLPPGEYRVGLLYQGPTAASAAQNRLRLIPFLDPAGGAFNNRVSNGREIWLRMDVPAGHPGFRGLLARTNGTSTELAVFRGAAIAGAQILRNAVNPSPDNAPTSRPETVWATDAESTAGSYLFRIQGAALGDNTVSFRWERGFAQHLAWDPGTADSGTAAFSVSAEDPGGLRFLRVNAEATDLGAWRTVLRVENGSATFRMQSTTPPANHLSGTPGTGTGASRNSAHLLYDGQYSPGQDWYIAVNSAPGTPWSLISGRAFAQPLGDPLPADTSAEAKAINDAATATVGPEGVRFFRATMPAGVPAWRLWLNSGGATPASLSIPVEVRQSRVPVPTQAFDLSQPGQMLVVPPYLNQANAFFIAIKANEGSRLNLDSRIHYVADLPYGSNVPATSLSGFRFRTYRVQVPPNVIGWQINARTLTGDVDVYLRRGEVGNAANNLTLSDAEGAVSDSITLVPPTLSDATYHLTVFGRDTSAFTLEQGNPVVTDLRFVNSSASIPGYSHPTSPPVLNDDTERNGWRYYRVSDIDSQLGVAGWLLKLSAQQPGTEIALRLSALPGRWHNGGHVDFSSTAGFLERQAHQAGVWYIGIYSPARKLGAFSLETRPFLPRPAPSDNTPVAVANQFAGSWEYFTLDVPTPVEDPDLRGLEIQLEGPNLAGLRTQVRRGALPYDVGAGMVNASATPTWPEGAFVSGGLDWTSRSRPDGASDYLFLPMGWPLQPGRYHIGVRNDSATPRSYALRIRTVGAGKAHPILPLDFSGPNSSVTATLPEPRQFQIRRLVVPEGTPMLRLRLQVTAGEARMILRRRQLPGLPGPNGPGGNLHDEVLGSMIARAGSEEMTFLPRNGESTIPAGDYHILTVAEGQLSNYNAGTVGTGPTTFTLSVLPPLQPTSLGAFGPGDERVVEKTFTPPERPFYHVDIQPGVRALEVRIEQVLGSTQIQWASSAAFPEQNSGQYGWISGANGYQLVPRFLHLIPPAPGRYGFTLESRSGEFNPHSIRVTLRALESVPLSALDGSIPVASHPPQAWRFYEVAVPGLAGGVPPAAWDLRVEGTSDAPAMVIARGTLPAFLGATHDLGYASVRTLWPTGAQVLADHHLSMRFHGDSYYNKQLHLGWGWPLTNDTYFVGVFNNAESPTSYTLRSRLVGRHDSTLARRVESIPWVSSGQLVAVSGLPAGEARYFRFNIPDGIYNFRLKVTNLRGDSRVSLRRGSLPGTHLIQGHPAPTPEYVTTTLARVGDEVLSVLPAGNETAFPPGEYFLTVISEGENIPANLRLGSGSSDLRIDVLPPISPVNLGTLAVNEILEFTNIIRWPDRTYYRLTIPTGARSLNLRIQNRTNQSFLLMRPGTNLLAGSGPTATDRLTLGLETWSGGIASTINVGFPQTGSSVTLNNPDPGEYMLLVDNDQPTAASIVTLGLTGEIPLAFLNAETSYAHPALAWRYFRVDVPTNAASDLGVRGWEVRLLDSPTDEGWDLRIRRDELPPGGPGIADNHTTWPSGAWYSGNSLDWTGRRIPGLANAPHLVSMAWGRPLQGGTYFIGVFNGADKPRSIRLRSRAIGEPGRGLPIEIQPLTFGAETEVTIPTPGDTRYFRLRPAPGLSAAQLTLQTLQGDARWAVRRGFVPATQADSGSFSEPGGQIRTANPGNEYITWGTRSADTSIPSDDHFILVAAEGAPTNPDNGFLGIGETRVRIGSTPFNRVFLGEVLPGRDLVQPDNYDAGEVLGYEFEIPAGTRAVEIRLEDRVGNPVFELGRGAGFLSGSPGWFDGFATNLPASRVRQFTIPEPAPGRYWIAVGRSESQPTAGSFRLRVRSVLPQPIAFSTLLNSASRTNVVSGSLSDGQRTYFSVEVPEAINGTPVIGWNLRLESGLGTPQVRVRPGTQLPEDSNRSASPYFPRGLVVAPPFLTPGTWTIEVRGFGDSQFTLRSERVVLERPSWTFPSALEPITAVHTADTHFLADGTELTNDVDLGQEQYHFYALDVPPNNGGLLRAELIALSGNSDLYVRAGAIPSREAARVTPDSGPVGAHDLSLTSGRISEFANWVPADTRREAALTPGRWYFLVHANGSNVRYRLRLTRGEVVVANSLTLTRANENVAAGDWRYFRFVVPQNPPQFWDVNVSQQQGDIDVHFRDSAPPGFASTGGPMGWEHEQKNAGVDYRSYPTPGTWRFSVPQLRPGQVYFVGVRGNVDSVFSINTSTDGPLLNAAFPPFETISPAGGLVSGTLAPAERRTWLVQAPADALRLKLTGTNATAVQFYLQNGSVPWASRNNPGDHWSSGGTANARFDTGLFERSTGNWPWIRGETFYIAVTNESASTQPFALRVDTRAWRLDLAATNGTIQANPLKTYYDDGETVSLTPTAATGHRFAGWTVDLSGTNQPGLVTFNAHKRVVALFEPIPYRLSLSATGGTIIRVPATATYPYGSNVRLTAVPSPGYEFVRWSGAVASFENPVDVPILGDTALTAHFNRFADPPEFTRQPAGGTFGAGLPLVLEAAATGTAPLSFEWLRNGARVGLTTEPRLTLAALRTNDAGFYSVRVTNAAGAITSAPAPVHVRFSQSISYTNPASIHLPDAAPAATYPSLIQVPAGAARLGGVSLTLHGLSHAWLEDLDALLVAPSGAAARILSDAGRGPVNDRTITLDDLAPAPLPEFATPTNVVFQPSDYAGLEPVTDAFPAPAPSTPPGLRLSGLLGGEVAGTWRLFLVDDSPKADGLLARGWSLQFQVFGLQPASDAAPVEPTFVTLPANQSIRAGESARFTADTLGNPAPTLRWQSSPDGTNWSDLFNGPNVTGAGTRTLTFANVPASEDGRRFRLSAVNAAGSAFSDPARLSVSATATAWATRILPGAYVPGRSFEVRIEVTPSANVAFHAIADRPPANWVASAISEGGVFDAATREVKFGPFPDNATRTLRYTLTPPAQATGRAEFSGTASADGVPSPIGGSTFVENTAAHPADTDANLRLVLDEVTGYGAAWKRGEPWSVAPNPIPVNYVTRAGFLWRAGEAYRLDASVGGAPTWWIPGTSSGSGRIAGPAIDPIPTLQRTVNGNLVTLSVVPGTGVSAYAIEERLFVGFNATDISVGGTFQSSDGVLRWGPFFDNQPRTFTYRLVPPANFDGEIALLGLLSADGESFPATGQAVVRFGSTPLPPPVRTDLEGDRLALDLSGPLNARVLIETAEALGAPWTLATEFQLSRPGQDWSVPVEIQNSGRFFRVRIEVP